MTQKIVCALFALAVTFTALNYASAEEAVVVTEGQQAVVTVAAEPCPCGVHPVVHRHGWFGYHYPAVTAPVFAPIPACAVAPPCSGPVTYRLGMFGRYYRPVYPRPFYPRYVTF